MLRTQAVELVQILVGDDAKFIPLNQKHWTQIDCSPVLVGTWLGTWDAYFASCGRPLPPFSQRKGFSQLATQEPDSRTLAQLSQIPHRLRKIGK